MTDTESARLGAKLGAIALAWFARAVALTIFVVVGHWVNHHLGGINFGPVPMPDGNDTGMLFNLHPVLMTLAFVVFMAEALLAYQAPLLPGLSREARKRIHWGCHTAAVACAAGGFCAVLQSHRLKRPTAMADWYSPHSYLGVTVLLALAGQFVLGGCAYLWPRFGLPSRQALGPVHRFLGIAVWVAGLAAIATGLQEKVTFLQTGRNMSGAALYGGIIRLPAAVLPLLMLLAAAVLYFHSQLAGRPPPTVTLSADGSGLSVGSGDGDEERLVLLADEGRRRE